MDGDHLPYQVLAQVILRNFKLTGHTFSSLKTETTKLPILHSEPYPAFFTPRTKKPSHLSSGKTSSKFDLLEIKIEEKIK